MSRSSTVRAELAELETLGLLTHPHTSAGGCRPRAATTCTRRSSSIDRGTAGAVPARSQRDAQRARFGAAVDDRDAVAGDAAARARLGAAARRPRSSGTSRCCAPAAGRDGRRDHDDRGVTKRVFEIEDPVDAGPRRVGARVPQRAGRGRSLGTHASAAPFDDRRCPRERAFLALLRPAFAELIGRTGSAAVRRRAAGLLGEARGRGARGVPAPARAARAARAVLELLSDALDPRRPFVRVGPAIEGPELHDVVATSAPRTA